MSQITLVANRAPFSLTANGAGPPRLQRAQGGIVNAFDTLRGRDDVVWFAVSMSDAEREMARRGPMQQQGFQVRFVPVERQTYHYAYNEVYNGVLWPICHGLPHWAPRRLDSSRWSDLWAGYKTYNRLVGEAIAAHLPADSVVLAQDLYFVFLAAELRRLGAVDLRTVLFLHLPFATPAEFAALPPSLAREILSSMTRFNAVGFLTDRWAEAFNSCCHSLGVEVPGTFVAAVAPPIARLSADAASPECEQELADLGAVLGGRKMLTQLDRMEPAKNIHGSLQAYDKLLQTRPELCDEVVFVVLAHPTRQGLAEYRSYATDVRRLAAYINAKHGSPSWQPVFLSEELSHFRHVAALRRYDVLLVNSVRDGMNLIALTGPQLNENCGVSVVSPEVGAFECQREWALPSDPADASATAQVLYEALTLSGEERIRRSIGLCTASAKTSGDEAVDRQIEAARKR